MDNIFRILSPDFRPTDVDMLSAYDASDCLQTSDIYYRKIKIKYVGGSFLWSLLVLTHLQFLLLSRVSV
jgi:hypothetical protein